MNNIHPAGGVIHINTASYLMENVFNVGIDIDFEEHLKECPNEDHDDCYNFETPTYIIGFKENDKTGKYEPDENAEFSAIIGETYAQVIQSKYYTLCRECSPCFPYQNNLDKPGDYETYSLPPDMYDEDFDTIPEIKRIDEHINDILEGINL